jgi:hypothetical protein
MVIAPSTTVCRREVSPWSSRLVVLTPLAFEPSRARYTTREAVLERGRSVVTDIDCADTFGFRSDEQDLMLKDGK